MENEPQQPDPEDVVHNVTPIAAAVFQCPCGNGSVITAPEGLAILYKGEQVMESSCQKCKAKLRYIPVAKPKIIPSSRIPNRHERRALQALRK
jgi:hypothetical protein